MSDKGTDLGNASWCTNDSVRSLLRFLQGAACTVIVLWGVRELSELIGPLLLRYLAVTGKATATNSLLNLILLTTMGVNNALLWALLYFFLNLIPMVGFPDGQTMLKNLVHKPTR